MGIGKFRGFFGGFTAGGPIEYLVAGLGNPGLQYEQSRHNAGFMAVDYIARQKGFTLERLKFRALCGEGVLGGRRVLFLKPVTFMNLSGEAVRDAARFYKLPMERVLIVHDDVSLPPGVIRIRRKGSDGGQKGIRSVITLTGQDEFPRIKIGVGEKPHPDMDLAAWVLTRFSSGELKALEPVWEKILAAAELIVAGRAEEAMNRYNG